MKIIVTSDSHGDKYSLNSIMSMHKDCDVVINCGDSRDDLDDIKLMYKDKMYYEVKGNCDFGSLLPGKIVTTIAGHKFFITHGHMYNAKYGLYNLVCAAREENCDFLLFGHTHESFNTYEDGMYIMNPGSCNGYNGTYGIIEILDNGILTNIAKLNK